MGDEALVLALGQQGVERRADGLGPGRVAGGSGRDLAARYLGRGGGLRGCLGRGWRLAQGRRLRECLGRSLGGDRRAAAEALVGALAEAFAMGLVAAFGGAFGAATAAAFGSFVIVFAKISSSSRRPPGPGFPLPC